MQRVNTITYHKRSLVEWYSHRKRGLLVGEGCFVSCPFKEPGVFRDWNDLPRSAVEAPNNLAFRKRLDDPWKRNRWHCQTSGMRHKPNPMERRIKVKTLNPYITCSLCRGYLIEATTITECLHTFCKSCIVKYLERNVTCPICEIVIHQSHPRNYISHDRTMQDIVYKLVPHIQEIQLKRQQDFYKRRGLEMPRSLSVEEKLTNGNLASSPEKENADHHRSDEQVNLCLECHNNQIKTLKRNFIRCSSLATISHLKKFLAFKLYNNTEKCKDVDILCNEEILGKDHTLKFIYVTRWRIKDAPLKLQYRRKVQL